MGRKFIILQTKQPVRNSAYHKAYLNLKYGKEWEKENPERYRKKYWANALKAAGPDTEREADMQYKEILFDAGEYGTYELEGTDLDFWKWMFEEKEYYNDGLLTMIACYAPDQETKMRKLRLASLTNGACARPCPVSNLNFCSKKTAVSYEERRKGISRKVEQEKQDYLKMLKEYSESFTRFSVETKSAAFFCNSTGKEIRAYLQNADLSDLACAFILYEPLQRKYILEKMACAFRF